jgi:transmembrane sensor
MDERASTPNENYENYSVEDFAADQDFVQWAKRPDAAGSLFWEDWLKQYPHKRADVEEACALVRSVEFPLHPDAQDAVQNVWEKIRTSTVEKQQPVTTGIRYAASNTWWKVAATVTGTLLMATVLMYLFWGRPVTYQTAFGETRQVELPDGSVAVLNANSSLRLGDSWETNREVWLEGEAFFSIRKKVSPTDPRAHVRFTVHTNTLHVNVLGTEFTVSERSKTMVVLNSGKIALSLPDKNIMMKPGDLVEVSGTTQELVQRTVNPAVYSAWKDNEWILDGLSLAKIADRIKETYGLDVVIKNPPDAAIEVTGVVPTGDLDILLKALSTVFERQFIRHVDHVLIE